MFRFTMPDPGLSLQDQADAIRIQLERYADSDALRQLLRLINADRDSIGEIYNGRIASNGRILETQELGSSDKLEPLRHDIYPLLRELGFFDISKAMSSDFTRIVILGGSLNACCIRTQRAASIVSESTVSVDALTCYRPINPVERRSSAFISSADTEFGVLSGSYADVFGLDSYDDEFVSDRNLNSISCIRRFSCPAGGTAYRLYAAPSGDPKLRRADTGDTFRFYLDNSDVTPDDSLLFITSNRYCNRQFIQLAYQLIAARRSVHFDIIGTTPDSDIVTPDTYEPFQYIQDMIGILDWIERFRSLARTVSFR